VGVSLGSRAAGTTNLGRFPANVLLDDDAAAVLDAEVGTLKSGKPGSSVRTAKGMVFAGGGKGVSLSGFGDSGGPSRFFYCTKVSKKERNGGVRGGCKHPTLKPLALTTYLARLLVPFSGAGSEMIGARRAGWRHVTGIEQDAQSVWDSRARLAHHVPRGRAA
jgi:site-specific DNA-methyltransferase (adenine-specific)